MASQKSTPQPSREIYSDLAHRLAPSLLILAKRLCPYDDDTCQDLVQHTLVLGYEKYISGHLLITDQVKGWFTRTLTNEFLQRIRKNKRLTRSELATENKADPTPRPDQQVDQHQLSDPVLNALAQLSPEHRTVVVLVDLQEMEYQQAAKILDLPLGTVRSRLARARLKLAAILAPHFDQNSKEAQS